MRHLRILSKSALVSTQFNGRGIVIAMFPCSFYLMFRLFEDFEVVLPSLLVRDLSPVLGIHTQNARRIQLVFPLISKINIA